MADAYTASYAGYPPATPYPPAAYAGYPAGYDPASAYYYQQQQYQQAYQQPPLPQDSSLVGAPGTETPPGSSPPHTAPAAALAPAAAAAMPDLASAASAAATAQQQYAAYQQQYQQYAAYQQYQQYHQDQYASYAAAGYGTGMPPVMPSTTPPAPLSVPQQQQEMQQHMQQHMQQQQQQQQQQQPSSMGGAAGGSTGTPQAGLDKAAAVQKGAATAAALAARMSAGAKGGYNAVPPPSNLASRGPHSQLKIRPQMGAAAAFNARNAGANASKPQASLATPAYVSAAPPSVSQQSATGGNKGSSDVRSPAAAAAAQQKAAAAGASKFPPSFTAWVERCFARCRVDLERQVMTRKLTARIKDVEAAGRMWMVDWDTEPIPSPSSDGPSSSSGGSYGGSAPSPKAASGGLPSRMKRSRWAEEEAEQNLAAQQQLQPRKLTKQQRQQLWQQQQQEGGKRQKKGAAAAAGGGMAMQEQMRRDARAGRFADGRAVGGLQSWQRRQLQEDGDSEYDSSGGEEELDLSTLTVKGTCTDLEKSYFRLTAAPDPSVVRPEPVLRRALDRLVGLLRQDAVNYFYACDQLKGMRQDCTVQHLRGGVAVAVYEAHARASLEYGDLAEFNQCQTQLASLYPDPLQQLQQQQGKGGIGSSNGSCSAASAPAAGQVAAGCVAEFVAYKVLYNAAHAHVGANKTVLLHTLRTAMALAGTPVDASGCIAHALASRAAAASCNFPVFFRLYVTAPALGRALLDVIAPKLRWAALNMLVKAYKTNLPVSFVAGVMGFCPPPPQQDRSKSSSTEQQRDEPLPGCRHAVYVGKAAPAATVEEGVAACVQWLKAHGAVVEEPEGAEPQLDVKASCAGRLSIPEEPKVSHGDENLSLQDFLSRAALGLGSNS